MIILTPVAAARSTRGQAHRTGIGKLPLRPVAGACHRPAQSQLVTVSKKSGYAGWPVRRCWWSGGVRRAGVARRWPRRAVWADRASPLPGEHLAGSSLPGPTRRGGRSRHLDPSPAHPPLIRARLPTMPSADDEVAGVRGAGTRRGRQGPACGLAQQASCPPPGRCRSSKDH